MKKLMITLILAVGFLAGCGSNGYEKGESTVVANSYQTLIEGKLYYIPHEVNKPDLPPTYERFIEENPELEVIDVEIDMADNLSHTFINGYFVFTK